MPDKPQAESAYHSTERSEVIELVRGRFGKACDIGGGSGATGAALLRGGLAESVDVFDLYDGEVDPAIATHLPVDLQNEQQLTRALKENGPYDLMLCLDVLEHLVDPWMTARVLSDALPANGQLIASIPNIRHYTLLRDLGLHGRWRYRDYGLLDRTHVRFFVKQTMIELLEDAGLKVERIEPLVRCGPKMRHIHRLTGGLIEDFVALQYVLFARKP